MFFSNDIFENDEISYEKSFCDRLISFNAYSID